LSDEIRFSKDDDDETKVKSMEVRGRSREVLFWGA
jgi:hypothetical protein